MPDAERKAESACRALYGEKPALRRACETGAEVGIAACKKEVGMAGRHPAKGPRPVVKLSGSLGGGLGYFEACENWCPDGMERVTVKKDKEGNPAICVCRLDPSTRKKARDETVKVTKEYQRKLKAFGTEKKPVHLRRCLAVDEKGRCVVKGEPLIRLTPVKRGG
ncbi:MAG: hypothetical protein ACREJF_07240 [Candidatus Methylomirabilales bacterium]